MSCRQSTFSVAMYNMCVNIYIYTYIPGTQITSILEGQRPKKNKANFPIKTAGSSKGSRYMCIYIYNTYCISKNT